jgi:hypothetical protein
MISGFFQSLKGSAYRTKKIKAAVCVSFGLARMTSTGYFFVLKTKHPIYANIARSKNTIRFLFNGPRT